MSQSDPPLPRDDGGPVFAEPWQAQAFALAVTLSDQGHFTWKEWAGELADTLRTATEHGDPDDGSRYYDYWLATLERVVIAKGLTDQLTLAGRKDAWIAAYRNTPHGTPIELPQPHLKLDTRWILPALMSGAVVYLITQYANVPQIGFFASAGFGSLLGIRHALEPDHLAAVSTLMTGERSSGRAAWLGACWGLGHTLTLLVAGGLLVLFRADMPPMASDVFELCVVLLLVGFGVRAIYHGKFRPRVAYRGLQLEPGKVYSVAVLPFFNVSDRRNAGEILALLFMRHLSTFEAFRVIDTGDVRQQLLKARIIMDGGLSVGDADLVGSILEADLVLGGRVLSYQDYEGPDANPRVDFSTVLFDRRTRRVVWSSHQYNDGTDGVRFFGRGRSTTAHLMATQMVRLATEWIAEGRK